MAIDIDSNSLSDLRLQLVMQAFEDMDNNETLAVVTSVIARRGISMSSIAEGMFVMKSTPDVWEALNRYWDETRHTPIG